MYNSVIGFPFFYIIKDSIFFWHQNSQYYFYFVKKEGLVMNFLSLYHLFKHKKSFFIMIVLLTVIFTMLPVAFKLLSVGQEQVQADITDFSRGKYDLLVRTSQTEHEEILGLVEENYLGVGDGGITLDEWQEISDDPRIEVAAPVASLGFFTKVGQSFQLPEPPEGPVRYTVLNETTDGLNNYVINEQVAYRLFQLPDGSFDTFYPFELMNVFNDFSGSHNFYIPSSYHPVVAIDPHAEHELTGIDFSLLFEDIHSQLNYLYEDANYIPLLDVSNTFTPIQTTLTVESVDVSEEDIKQLKNEVGMYEDMYLDDLIYYAGVREEYTEEKDYVENYLNSLPAKSEDTYKINFFEYLSAFEQDWYMLDEEYQVVMGSEYDIHQHGEVGRHSGFNNEQNIFYRASPPAYEVSDDKLSVKLVDMEGDIPIHRELEEIEYQQYNIDGINDHLHYFIQVGQVDVGDVEHELAASPLGIYHYQYGTDKETNTELQPTHHAGSFLPLPANGLVSIEWAEYFKGDAPIDAIRIKVAGITGYTDEAAALIREVAEDIEALGFHVDIIAGSSHQTIDVDVEGIGIVSMPWTTLGAAESIIQSWNIFSIIISSAFLLIAILSLMARFRVLHSEVKAEQKRLALIGWSDQSINRFYLNQWLFQVIVSILISLVILIIFFEIDLLLIVGLSITVLLIFLLKFIPNRLLKRNKSKVFKPSPSILTSNIRFYKDYILASSLQIILLLASVGFLITVSNIISDRIRTTNLGEYIHFQIDGSQQALLIGSIALTTFTLTESLYRLWLARKKQIQFLTVVGWRNGEIVKSVFKETLAWMMPVIVIGGLLASILVFLLFDFTLTIVSLNIIISLIILSLFSLFLFISLSLLLNRKEKGETI